MREVTEVKVLADGWTVVTEDGKLSAHFEHSVAITENGPDDTQPDSVTAPREESARRKIGVTERKLWRKKKQ